MAREMVVLTLPLQAPEGQRLDGTLVETGNGHELLLECNGMHVTGIVYHHDTPDSLGRRGWHSVVFADQFSLMEAHGGNAA
jgi:hypothetical protein